ncbi:MAG: hypothetical protein LBU29_00900 [Endomicrobium sp.]|jgi:hypothetical protein|nr:hypothetical protein [Endomicrobium sp.]
MRKIKNFKINLRVKKISQTVRRLLDSVDVSVEFEETVRRCCGFYFKFLSPSVVYGTFSKGILPSSACKKEVPSRWVAESVFFVTIGNGLSQEHKKSENVFGEYTDEIVSVIAADALDQSRNFTQRLIAAEAQCESCKITKIVDIPVDLYDKFSKFVAIDKIDISVKCGGINPKYSTCGLFYWVPFGKRRPIKKVV